MKKTNANFRQKYLGKAKPVDGKTIIDTIKAQKDHDLYTYFVSHDAINSGFVPEQTVGEFVRAVYADYYFLHRYRPHNSVREKMLYTSLKYSPSMVSVEDALAFLHSGKLSGILPITKQDLSPDGKKYFVCVDSAKLYGIENAPTDYPCRFYLNLPAGGICECAREILHKCFIRDVPATLKALNNDYRSDTITIYTPKEFAGSMVEILTDLKNSTPSLFAGAGKVCDLLSVIDGFIGYGEQSGNEPYLYSRCMALAGLQDTQHNGVLKESLLGAEEKIVTTASGEKLTLSETAKRVLMHDRKIAIQKIISEMLHSHYTPSWEIKKMYETLNTPLDKKNADMELKKLTRTFTRGGQYKVEVNGTQVDSTATQKLYAILCGENYKMTGLRDKQRAIAKAMFVPSESVNGQPSREFLVDYFKCELAYAIKDKIDNELQNIGNSSEHKTVTAMRMKKCVRLKKLLGSILDGKGEGKEYVDACIEDYLRTLKFDTYENVCACVGNREIAIEKDVNLDIVNLLPELKAKVEKLSESATDVLQNLALFDMNPENISLALSLDDEREDTQQEQNFDSNNETEIVINVKNSEDAQHENAVEMYA